MKERAEWKSGEKSRVEEWRKEQIRRVEERAEWVIGVLIVIVPLNKRVWRMARACCFCE